MAGKKQIPKQEYEQLPRYHFRDRNGNAYTVYMGDSDLDPVYIKQVRKHVRVDKVTGEQWANAILNHGMR